MDAFLARIEALNPGINAFCVVAAEEARAGARTAEAALVAGAAVGPLHGVPVPFKDLTATAGGRYLDRLEKRDGEWRIALRRLVVGYRYINDGSVFGDWDGYPKGTQSTSDISYERPLGLPDELLAAMR